MVKSEKISPHEILRNIVYYVWSAELEFLDKNMDFILFYRS
jgi:hypothetical protein